MRITIFIRKLMLKLYFMMFYTALSYTKMLLSHKKDKIIQKIKILIDDIVDEMIGQL